MTTPARRRVVAPPPLSRGERVNVGVRPLGSHVPPERDEWDDVVDGLAETGDGDWTLVGRSATKDGADTMAERLTFHHGIQATVRLLNAQYHVYARRISVR